MHHTFSLAFLFAALELHVARLRTAYALSLAALVCGGVLFAYVFVIPPVAFPIEQKISIQEGDTLYATAQLLEHSGFIHSTSLFMAVARITGNDTNIQAGEYIFHSPEGMLGVLHNLAHGITGIEVVRVALFEGMTARDMAGVLERALPNIDRAAFEEKAIPLEGYLFPDTYFFPTDITTDEVIDRLYENFNVHIEEIAPEVTASNRSLRDIVIMASLLEREARSLKEKRMIAGILWHRIERDMLLQVDAVFGYIQNRATYSPSFSDLEIDSPYNTYKYKGLPPGPIANPGLDSLLAAVTPTSTDALYYLTGRDGRMHYAKTFAEHKVNRARYLD